VVAEASVEIEIVPTPVARLKIPPVVVKVVPPLPVLKSTSVVPVTLPIVMTFWAATVPIFNAPVPESIASVLLVDVKVMPADPAWSVRDAAPETEPTVTTCAAEPSPRWRAPALFPVKILQVCVPDDPFPDKILTVELPALAPAEILTI
jgi:hypothetical protein